MRPVLTAGELGGPDRGVERCGEVDVVHHPARLEVRFAPRDEQIAHREVCLRAVQVHARLVGLERYGLTPGAHATMLASSNSSGTKPGTVLVFGIRGQQRVAWASVLVP